jgi:ATP phosphoribosyltransferase
MPVALVFLPASDIALYVAQGRVDVGITGIDIVAEKRVEVDELVRLGYGKCRLCVQAPVKAQITDARQLVGKRVVTSFTNLAAEYFGALDPTTPTTISYVSGSVEAACALGLAEAIGMISSHACMKFHAMPCHDMT